MSSSFKYSQLSDDALSFLKTLSFSSTGTRRLCLHESLDSALHVMLIEIKPDTDFKRHSHTNSDEMVYLVAGSLAYHFDNDESSILSKDGTFSIIIPKGCCHSVRSGPDGALYLEVINGPFIKG